VLIFEKPQAGVSVDLTGLTEEEAIARVSAMQASLPPHPSTINLGCGPEPQNVNLDAVLLALRALSAEEPGDGGIPSAKIEFAERTGAWFYWSYACRLAAAEIKATHDESTAIELIYGEDLGRDTYYRVRREKLRWVVRERFGIEL
jgi:hypothetical protein